MIRALIFLMLISSLFAGCSIRRNSKLQRQSQHHAEELQVKNRQEVVHIQDVDKADVFSQKLTRAGSKLKVYPSPGVAIQLSPDGKVTVEADSLVQERREQVFEQTESALSSANQILLQLQDSSHTIHSNHFSDSHQESISKPSIRRVAGYWIGLVVGLLLVVTALAWWFRWRR